MKKIKSFLFVALFAFALTSCYSVQHVVGMGARGNTKKEQKQWYALWGAIPINNADSQAMAAGAEDYTIETKFKVGDYIINAFTSVITVQAQTVIVTK